MRLNTVPLRRHAARLLALGLACATYGFARLPSPSRSELARLAADFRFRALPLPTLTGDQQMAVREVNPSLRGIAGWVSSVGAAVALNDLDGDGLPNDVCHVDTRINRVVVTPAPGTTPRYAPFALDPRPLPYDAATTAPMGCLPGDFDEDGSTDLLVYYWGRTPVVFLRQGPAGPGGAAIGGGSYVPRELAGGGERWYTNAATQADLDGDGHADLIFGNYFPDGARVLDARTAAPDGMQESMSFASNGGGPHFLLWKRPAAGLPFTYEVERGLLEGQPAHGWTLAVAAGDLDGDLLPEVYVANDFGPDHLLHNRSTPGAPRFELLEGRRGLLTAKSKVLGRDSFKGMGVDFGDINGDGWPDIYVSNIAEEYALEESHFVFLSTGRVELMRDGVAPYVDRSEQLGLSRGGWAWDARLADFDNDGTPEALQATGFLKGTANRWPDLHELAMANDQLVKDPRSWPALAPGADLSGHEHNPFYARAADGRFYDIAAQLGMDQPMVSRGIATADVDADGRLDFAVANQWETSYFYHNEADAPGDFIGLRLRLPAGREAARTGVCREGGAAPAVTSRPAIGAQARVLRAGAAPLAQEVDGGGGHSGKKSPDLLFGLGRAREAERVTVELRWRDTSGAAHRATLQMTPNGWYTVLLGRGEEVRNECA